MGSSRSILIFVNHDGSLFNFRIEIIRMLIEEGYSVHFSVPYGPKVPLIKMEGAIFHSSPLQRRSKNPLDDLQLLAHYCHLIRLIKPAVVLSYTSKANIYGGIACRLFRTPQIANITGIGTELYKRNLIGRILSRLYSIGLQKTGYVVFQNEANLKYFYENKILEATPETRSRCVLLPGSGVNISKFFPDENKRFQPAQRAHFVFIGRIMRDKGIEEFLTAAERIKEIRAESRFSIIGFYEEDAYKPIVESLISRGIIDYVGHSEDTRIQMREADCLVLPSYHEGLSNVVLEAASSGLPVVTSDIPGCREAVMDGESGILVKVKDVESLVKAMLKICDLTEDQKGSMGMCGRNHVVEHFNRDNVVEFYKEKIERLLKN